MSATGVILDYGLVVSMPQPIAIIDEMAGVLRVTTETLLGPYWALREAYDRGALSGRAYWRDIARTCGVDLDDVGVVRLLHLDGESWSVPNTRVVAWIEKALDRGIPVALLSNMPAEVRDHIVGHAAWLPPFVHATYSCDLGVAKPAPEIYESSARGVGLAPPRLLFVDDRPVNVEGARRVGMQALLFDDTERALAALDERLGL